MSVIGNKAKEILTEESLAISVLISKMLLIHQKYSRDTYFILHVYFLQ